MGKNRQKWIKIDKNGQKSIKMDKNGQKSIKIDKNQKCRFLINKIDCKRLYSFEELHLSPDHPESFRSEISIKYLK